MADERWRRLAAWLAGLWAGFLLAIGGVAAPGLFSVLERAPAGQVAGRLFTVEAYVSLALAVVLVLIERRRIRALIGDGGESGYDPAMAPTSQVTPDLLLLLGALFCTVLGHFGLQPVMQAAREGSALLSFGAAHGLSTVLYGLKTVLVLALAWRATRR